MSELDDFATEGILLIAPDGRVAQANRRAHELLPGVTGPLVGADFWEVVPAALAQEHQAPARRALAAGKSYTMLDHDEFSARWVEYVVSRQEAHTLVHLRNVSDRHRLMGLLRESERRSQGLFEANPNVMWVFDTESLSVLGANRAAVKFYGYTREEFLALTANKFYPESDEKELRNSLPALESRTTSGGHVMRLCKQRKRDGQVQMVEISGLPVEWNGKRAILVTLADVTTRYLADAQLRQENADLEQRVKERTTALQDALRELGSLQYAMSHDLQSPLHAVGGFTKVLLTQYGAELGEQGLHYLRRIQAGVDRMGRLIEDLRMLSRISRLTMQPRLFDLAPVALSILENMKKRDPQRSVQIEIEKDMSIHADQELVTTALMAMLDNAWKFTSRKEQAWIKIGVAVGKNPGERVIFVSDNGAGYDAAYADKLFTAFQRLHSSADFPGAGLGLAIVQRVAMRHAGQVWSESAPPAGATFYLSLPQPGSRPRTELDDGTPRVQVQVHAANR